MKQVFAYTALNPRGQEVKGELVADSSSDAVNTLRKEGLFPTYVDLVVGKEPPAPIVPEKVEKSNYKIAFELELNKSFWTGLFSGVALSIILFFLIKLLIPC